MKVIDFLVNELNKQAGEETFKRLHSEQYQIVQNENGIFKNKTKSIK